MVFISNMLEKQTGHQNKSKKTLYNKGDLLYWNDFWNSSYGIGIFLEYASNFNVKDIYSNEKNQKASTWVKLLVANNGKIDIRTFPQTSISLTSNHQSLEEFQDHVSKFRLKRNK